MPHLFPECFGAPKRSFGAMSQSRSVGMEEYSLGKGRGRAEWEGTRSHLLGTNVPFKRSQGSNSREPTCVTNTASGSAIRGKFYCIL